jgi:hypothetical protein
MWLTINVPGVGPIQYQVPGHTGVIYSVAGQGPHDHDAKAHKHYPELIVDATIVASIQQAAKNVADSGGRDALLGGVKSAIQALQKRAGKEVTITE